METTGAIGDPSTLNSVRWTAAPGKPVLGSDEVHLWRADLDKPHADFTDVLSTEEIIRAERCHTPTERTRFVVSRGLLRMILARYVDMEPAEIQFAYGAFGKPSIPLTHIRFNVSQSENLVLIAISRVREVGVDVEQVRNDLPFEEIAQHYLEPEETWGIRTTWNASQKAWTFFDFWTSKEACLKASGMATDAKIISPDRWSLQKLSPAEGFTAALAVEGGGWQLACWEWQ